MRALCSIRAITTGGWASTDRQLRGRCGARRVQHAAAPISASGTVAALAVDTLGRPVGVYHAQIQDAMYTARAMLAVLWSTAVDQVPMLT